MQQLLTVHKILWGVKIAALGECMQRKRSDLDRFLFTPNSKEMI